MALLFHPSHRKFIKLLRSYADRGTYFCITDLDREKLVEIFHRTNDAVERHKSIYMLLLKILNRHTSPEEGHLFTHEIVDNIEKFFARIERKRPCFTFREVVIGSFLRFLLRRLKARKYKKGSNEY